MIEIDGWGLFLWATRQYVDASMDAAWLTTTTKKGDTVYDAIREGVDLITATLSRGPVGPYQVQAAIAAVHDQAARAEDTDWPQINGLYELLERVTGNPVVTLNRAVATAMADGPEAGLAVVDTVDDRLAGHYRLDAVRAHLLEMAGDSQAALPHYRAAAAGTTNLAERRYLTARAAALKPEAARPRSAGATGRGNRRPAGPDARACPG